MSPNSIVTSTNNESENRGTMNIPGSLGVLALVVIMSFSGPASAQSPMPFVSKDFKIPETLETPEFRLRMLSVGDVVKDYDAVMSSTEHLSEVWPGGTWPAG